MTKNYTPVDTDHVMYMLKEATLADILQAVKDKWGDIDFHDVDIESEYIHTRCLGYDLYDASDFDEYLVITFTP